MKFLLGILFLALCSGAQADCATALDSHLKTDMALSYQQFDQTEGQGMRALAEAGCFAEAEQLILAYIKEHGGNSTLWWHAAQQAASANNYAEAAQHAKRSLGNASAKSDDPLLWNEYVLASIAFFERDKPALQRYRNIIAEKGMAFWGNRLNVNLLDSMLENFDMSYAKISEKAMKKWRLQSSKSE